ncbi:MAG: glycosyltransferase [Methyloprofundus sp.]|nr:glycosyltransferase [Methyloprofundus sp.]
MTTKLRLSVIVPTLDRPQSLQKCLDALVQQSYSVSNFEVIVVDDGSQNTLNNLIASYSESLNIHLLRQANAGPAAARNKGATIAAGQWLAFTDDDCTPAPDWLCVLDSATRSYPTQLLGGFTINALTENIYASASQSIQDIVYRHYNARPLQARFFASNNMAVPAQLFAELEGFDASFRTSEDRELCDRCLHQGKQLVYIPEAIVYHAHRLNFSRYCRQHFGYGRGAYRFHRLRAQRNSGNMQKEMTFHLNLRNWLTVPFRQYKGLHAITLAILLVCWQQANLMGFVYEAARNRFKIV